MSDHKSNEQIATEQQLEMFEALQGIVDISVCDKLTMKEPQPVDMSQILHPSHPSGVAGLTTLNLFCDNTGEKLDVLGGCVQRSNKERRSREESRVHSRLRNQQHE